MLPVLIGHTLATRDMVPGFDLWVGFWSTASASGASFGLFVDTLRAWLALSWRFLLALVVAGPLLWLATLLINDVHDLPGDRENPRKAKSPLVQGLVRVGWAHRAAYVVAVATLVLAVPVGWTFAGLILVAVVLAWVYSAPPLRLKTRPGADVALNAIGIGLGAGLAGWSIAAPLSEVPWAFVPQGLLVAVAVYVPTTLVDYESDVAAGYETFATKLGPKAAYRVGWAAWVLANVGALWLSWTDRFLPHEMFPVLVVFVPVLLLQYHAGIGRAASPEARIAGIVLTSLTFLAVNMVFALMYTGLWVV